MKFSSGPLLIFIFILGSIASNACTIFCGIDKNGHVLIANNEDHRPAMNIYFKVRAATDSTYGFFGTTYLRAEGWIQGGSNDQGLFFDTNELGEVPLRKTAGSKPYQFAVDPGTYVLQNCKNVEEVIEFFNTYLISIPAQVHLADKNGNFAIVINDTIIRSDSNFQLTTNFHPLDHNIGVYPCWRYDAVSEIINKKGISNSSFLEAMKASEQHGNTVTLYSSMGNLATGDWTYYQFNNKYSSYNFNIHELLKKGDKNILLRDLIPDNPYTFYYTASVNKSINAAISDWKKHSSKYTSDEKYEIPRLLVWNFLFWDRNYDAASKWLDIWWPNVEDPTADDLMTRGIVEVMTNKEQQALKTINRWLIKDPLSVTAKHYKAFLNRDYENEGRLRLKLPGYKKAAVVSVGGISVNPNYYLMHRTEQGWEISIDVMPGMITYYFLVDGEKVLDPLNPQKLFIPTAMGPEEMNLIKLDRGY